MTRQARHDGQRPNQRGIALITAMLVTAIAATAAVNMASRQQIDFRRSSNLFDSNQAYLFAMGVESWAAQILDRDAQAGKYDHLGEDWAINLPPIGVEDAIISGGIEDLQGRFNLNNLIKDGQASQPDIASFKRLLKALKIDEAIADAVVDWVDTDETPTLPDGAEDVDYLVREPGYRTPNTLMASPSELLLVKGMDTKTFNQLAPYVQCLPVRTPVNVNTASVPVLMALAEGLDKTDAEQIKEDLRDSGIKSTAEFMALPIIKGLARNIDNISVQSHYFMITANTEYKRSQLQIISIVSRSDAGKIETLERSRGGY